MGIAYTKTATTISLLVDFRSVVIPKSHPNYAELVKLAENPNSTEADIKPLLDVPAAIVAYTGGDVQVINGKLFYRGVEVKNNLATIILGFVKSGQPEAAEPFKRFLANCRQNPDLALVETIYDWVVKAQMPITPEGEIIAWKIVQRDYMSKHAGKRGKLDHSIGKTVSEPREECNPNRNQTCSTGIHFCSLEYLEKGNYGSIDRGDRIVAVVINPMNITAIPTDYNLSKGRCCELRVVGEVDRQDKIKSFYDGSGKVYSGWSAPAPAAPKTRFPVQVGDVWRTRAGDRVVVNAVSSDRGGEYDYATLSNGAMVFTDDGTSNRVKIAPSVVAGRCLVELISEKPKTPRNAHGFAVDQTWVNRRGDTVKITSISRSGSYPVATEGKLYTASGRFNSDTSTSAFDLIRLVKDVD